jgi:Spy/CpxP family protein refolding chaperone
MKQTSHPGIAHGPASSLSRTAPLVRVIMISSVLAAGIIFSLPGCGASENTAPGLQSSPHKTIASARTGDVRVLIAGFQQIFQPAGIPLTEEQQEKFKKIFNPDSSDDMRPYMDILTKEQKKVLADTLDKRLEKAGCPLTKSQKARLSAFGPNSKEKNTVDFLTPEQKEALMRVSR